MYRIRTILITVCFILIWAPGPLAAGNLSFPVVDSGQTSCYDLGEHGEIPCPGPASELYGQDAQHVGLQPAYRDNGDGTITDTVTGLMWQQGYTADVYWSDAESLARASRLGGYDDWRVPTIKELYSLITFQGQMWTPQRPGPGAGQGMRPGSGSPPPQGAGSSNMPRPGMMNGQPPSGSGPQVGMDGMREQMAANSMPYIDTDFFEFEYPSSATTRVIDAQYISSTVYQGLTMMRNRTFFGVNFADGRIKGYGMDRRSFYLRLVRGPSGYGENDFHDNGDGTVTDRATGLTWMQPDSGDQEVRGQLQAYYHDGRLDWPEALSFCEYLQFAGHDDWRLPEAKELQSIVDYGRSPQYSDSAAIDPVFRSTPITDESGRRNWPHYWTSTTHLDGPNPSGRAVLIAFGEALGTDPQGRFIMDVHGAGAQRSDPKVGSPDGYPTWGTGPQGDVQRVFNYARCVR